MYNNVFFVNSRGLQQRLMVDVLSVAYEWWMQLRLMLSMIKFGLRWGRLRLMMDVF